MRILLLTILLFSTLLAKDKPLDTTNYKDEELKLMLQSFLYLGDTEDAYKVAIIGYKKYPDSIFWNKQAIDTARWSGHYKETVKYEIALYKKTHDPKLRDDIINYGLSDYQYEQIEELTIEKAIENPNDENIKMMIYIQNLLGTPEKAARILEEEYQKDKTKTDLLTKELQIYLDLGDLDSAKKIVHIIEELKLYNIKNVSLVSYYYYLKRDLKASYNVLLMIKTTPDKDDVTYYQLLSDLGWHMQDDMTAANASKILMQSNQARLVDYIRVMEAYENKDTNLSIKATYDAYEKYKLSYLFYQFANSAIKLNQYEKLQNLINKIDKSDDDIKKEAKYWIVKSELYMHFNNQGLALNSLNKALLLEKDNLNIQLSVFWFYLEHNLNKNLKEFMLNIEDSGHIDPNFYLPFASSYYQFNDIKHANYYVQKILDTNDNISKTTDFKFLQAYLYQIQDNEDAYKKKLKEILKDLEMQSIDHPGIKLSNAYWVSYLNAAMPIVAADTFEKLLSDAKKYLTPDEYSYISYSWAIENNADEKSHEIYNNTRDKELWMRFSDALLFQDHTAIENLIDGNVTKLSPKDVAKAAKEDGQISLAQSLGYDILSDNDYSQEAYIQHLDLSNLRSDEFNSQVSYYRRASLLQKYVTLDNRTYLGKSWYLYAALDYYRNNTLNSTDLNYLNINTAEADVDLKKRFDRSDIEAHIGYKHLAKSYYAYGLAAHAQLSTNLQADFALEKNLDVDDTIAMRVAGKKDMVSGSLDWKILKSISLGLLYEQNQFYSQDNVNIGEGKYAKISLSKQLRDSYPDIGLSVYYDKGAYHETAGLHGIIDEIQNGNDQALPDNFNDIGAELRVGMQHSENYSKIWKPYFTIAPVYTRLAHEHSYNVAVTAGYSGKVWHQDHLNIGAYYSRSRRGVNDRIIEFFIKYQFSYLHP